MEANGLDTKSVHSIQEDSSIIALVESGLGVSIMPELVLEKNSRGINVYPIESAPYRLIGIATLTNTHPSSPVSAIVKLIMDYVREEYPTEMPYFRK